jgi:hypothetical protein
MPYIGNTVQTQGFTPAVDYFNGNGVTVTFTLSRPVASVAQMIVAIDNVIQNPSSAFTVSGSSITFTSAPLSGTNNIWVEYTSLITTYAGISQDPSVIGDITATGGYLSTGDFGNSFIDGTLVDYVTGRGRVTVGELDDITFYHGGTAGRSEMLKLSYAGNSKLTGNLGVNVTPSAWGSGWTAVDVGPSSSILSATLNGADSGFGMNLYFDGTNWKYKNNGYANLIYTNTTTSNGSTLFYSAASGTAGNNASLANVLSVGAGGKTLALENASPVTGTGISFPATQSASTDPNTLDDYEEGTWTATYSAGTIVSQSCQYTKVGRLVTATFGIQWTAVGTSLGQIGGLPFNLSGVNYVGTHGREWYNTGNTTQCIGSIGSATMDLFFYNNTRGVTNGSSYGISGTIVYNAS